MNSNLPKQRRNAGFSLVEMLIAVTIATSVIGVVAVISVDTALHYAAIGNYVTMADQSRNAMDMISREVRSSNALIAFSTNTPVYLELSNSTSSTITTIYYDNTNSYLSMSKTGQSNRVLLTQCNFWTFSLYNRHPLINSNDIYFYPSTNYSGQVDASRTKVINMSWKCTRSVLGTKLDSQSVQTAQVILRNKVK